MSKADYAVGKPEGEFVPFRGGHLYVETYRPVGPSAPEKVPTVLIMSPYNEATGVISAHGPVSSVFHLRELGVVEAVNLFVPRGYAVAIADVPGSGSSDGCIDSGGPTDVAAASRMVEWLAAESPWGNGVVGMYGLSYPATVAYAVATRGTPAARSYLKAIIPVSGVLSEYDAAAIDGVTNPGLAAAGYMTGYGTLLTILPGNGTVQHPVPTGRHRCTAYQAFHRASTDPHGNFSAFWADREYRSHVDDLRAATLLTYGQLDDALWTMQPVGFFDRIPSTTPHKLLFGHHTHEFPQRADWPDIALAWFDRFLKGLPTGAEAWPDVQVEDASGTWRAQRSWPEAGSFGQLALGANRVLGEEASGEVRYVEGSVGPDGAAVFTTAPLAQDLRISGMPVLDLWVELDRPDAHVVTRLDVVRPGEVADPIAQPGLSGARSAQHLDPLVHDRFEQRVRRRPPVHKPVHIPVRFMPSELLVPAGSSLRLTVTWVAAASLGDPDFAPTTPSGVHGVMRILFDCETPSVLRFALPADAPELLAIPGEPAPPDVGTWSVDGGIAREPVCGKKPLSPLAVTRHK